MERSRRYGLLVRESVSRGGERYSTGNVAMVVDSVAWRQIVATLVVSRAYRIIKSPGCTTDTNETLCVNSMSMKTKKKKASHMT